MLKMILKFKWKYKVTQIANTLLTLRIKLKAPQSQFQDILLESFNQTAWQWCKNRHVNQWKRQEIPGINPRIYNPLIIDK